LFNHESFRRGEEFVTKKITSAAVAGKKLFLGNMEARRDWGHAVDYVRAMWLMLQQDKADDYVVSTGITHSVRELCDLAFKNAGLDYRRYVDIDENLKRPTDVEYLCGDSSKARNVLGWFPEYGFKELIVDMM
jgi:GDPmannose 4,6-dehydratase